MTAEFVVAMPSVILLLAVSLSALQLAGTQLRLQDAAAGTARIVARSGDAASAADYAARVVAGAMVDVERRGELICARVRVLTAVGGIFGSVALEAASCALGTGQ